MLRTLHSKLLVLIIIVALFPLTIVEIVSYNSQKENLTHQLESSLFFMAENLADDVDVFVRERINDTNLLASNPVLRSSMTTKEEKVREFQNFLDIHEEYFGAIQLNNDGIVTIDMDGTVIGKDLSSRNWFQESLEGNVYFSDIYMSSVVHNPMVVLASSVRDEENEIIGVLSPSLDLDYLWRILDKFNEDQRSVNIKSNAFLMNGKGDIIADIDRDKILKVNFLDSNQISHSELIEMMNKRELMYDSSLKTMNAFAKIGQYPGFENDWYLGIAMDKQELYGPLKSLLYKYIIIFATLLLVTIIMVIKLAKYIVDPVQKLVVATSNFAKGKKVPHLKLDTYKEINTLSNTFNRMMDKLEARERGHKKSTLILEKINNGVISINRESLEITTFNNKCEEIFYIENKKIVGMNVYELCNANESFEEFLSHSPLKEMITNKEFKNTSVEEFESIIDGKKHAYLGSISIIEQSKGQHEIVLVFNDITQNKAMMEQLIQAGKLELAGQVAAGVAHEIRNPLTTIKAFFQLFFKQEDCQNTREKYYDLITQELNRINEIVSEFLSLAKPDTGFKRTEVDLIKVLNDTLTLMEPQALINKVEVVKEYDEIPTLLIDGKRIKQVFINLIKNSFEAMPYGGTLTIGADYLEDVGIVRIKFSDTGAGMDEQTLEKLGTPFFTTKEKGMGLGTMTSYRIVEEMNGSLTVDTEEGKGTTFTIKIPV